MTYMIDKFDDKIYNISHETVLELCKHDNGSISNVVRGLQKECYGLKCDSNDFKKLSFFYINYSADPPGLLFKLELKEESFYEYLLGFSLSISKHFDHPDPINIYNTFIYYLRTILEQCGYFTVSTAEIKKLPRGELLSPSPIEIIKNFDKEEFYRYFLNYDKSSEIIENVNYLYIMLNKATSLFKIGYSKNPEYREKTLQSEEPKIILLKVWECDKCIEREIHKYFEKKRIRGEWFKLNIKDLMELDILIDKIKSTIADAALKPTTAHSRDQYNNLL